MKCYISENGNLLTLRIGENGREELTRRI